MRNISQRAIREVRIAAPSLQAQAAVSETVSALSVAKDVAMATAERLRAFRTNLQTALLSGEHEIPQSYDELIEEVA